MLSLYAAEWRRVLLSFEPEARTAVQTVAQQHSQSLAEYFYSAMLGDEAAAGLLSHEQVQTRLMGSMRRWIEQLFSAQSDDDLEALVQQQVSIGEVHARMDVPVHLVLRGARYLKQGLHDMLAHGAHSHAAASQLAVNVIDHAMEVMTQGYSTSRDRNARSTEAYRLFTITQNLSTVRERLRAELLDWQNQCLFMHAMGTEQQAGCLLSSSDFGLWFRHKGMDMFQGAAEVHAITEAIERIDHQWLPALRHAQGANAGSTLLKLREDARHIALSMDALFTRNSELDAGRDVLTQLLNRKFLPVVLTKEVAFARKTSTVFSVLSIDIDHFKQINDQYGHEGGDMVLEQMASLLSSNIRGGDYLFRLGGEEFLMILVDTSPLGALRVAEKLRLHISQEPFRLPQRQHQHVTISIGVASFDGHPDYQRLLRYSDEALYLAKQRGRNRVEVAAAAMDVCDKSSHRTAGA